MAKTSRGRSLLRHTFAALALLWISLGLTGCAAFFDNQFGPNRIAESLDPEFSNNIMAPPWWWPDEDSFDPDIVPSGKVQKAYFEEHGAPNWMRAIYNTEGTIIPFEAQRRKGGNRLESRRIDWIYVDRNVEVSFTAKGFEEKPINDEVKRVLELGDPDVIMMLKPEEPNLNVKRRVRYRYYREGLMITFEDLKETKVDRHPPLQGWLPTAN